MNDKYKTEETGAEELIYGRNPVSEALKAGRAINKVLIANGETHGALKPIEAMCAERGLIVKYVGRNEIERAIRELTGERNANHQGVAAYLAAAPYAEPEDILAAARAKGEKPFVIVLDGIQDPHNLGAIIRTADAVGAHGVIVPKRRACALTGAVAKASAGALAHVPVARVVNIARTLELLKAEGLWVAGTDLSGETGFFDADLDCPLAIVIGSEGEGMAELTRKNCDFVLTIPMKGQVTSLNASVAAGIVMYEVFRQRRK